MKKSSLLAEIKNIEHGFTNRETDPKFLEKLEAKITLLKQMHGNAVFWIEQSLEAAKEGDGLATKEKNLCIGIRTADCCPILICALDSKNNAKAVMALHAGWRGTVAEIAVRGLRSLDENIALKDHTFAICLGPTISKNKFEVGEEVALHFADNEKTFLHEKEGKKFLVDLQQANIRQIKKFTKEKNISVKIDAI